MNTYIYLYIVGVYANQSRHVSRRMQALLYGNTPHRIRTNTHLRTQRNTRRKHIILHSVSNTLTFNYTKRQIQMHIQPSIHTKELKFLILFKAAFEARFPGRLTSHQVYQTLPLLVHSISLAFAVLETYCIPCSFPGAQHSLYSSGMYSLKNSFSGSRPTDSLSFVGYAEQTCDLRRQTKWSFNAKHAFVYAYRQLTAHARTHEPT